MATPKRVAVAAQVRPATDCFGQPDWIDPAALVIPAEKFALVAVTVVKREDQPRRRRHIGSRNGRASLAPWAKDTAPPVFCRVHGAGTKIIDANAKPAEVIQVCV